MTWNEITFAKKVRQLQDNIALFEYYNMWILISRQFTALFCIYRQIFYFCDTELKSYKRNKVEANTESQDYKWHTKDWNECTKSCGGGQRNRETFCADEKKKKVDESLCKGIGK